jgi:hypothetical protein
MKQQSNNKMNIKKITCRYSRYFKVLLILSTIGTSLSIIGGLISSVQIPASFSVNLAYGIMTVTSYITVIIATIGLWFLWKKKYIGLILKLSSYGLTVLSSCIMLAISQPIIEDTVKNIRDQTIQSGQEINLKLIEAVVNLTFSLTYVAAIVGSVTFGILWCFAWRSQQKYDA